MKPMTDMSLTGTGYKLTLYVTGQSRNAENAITNLDRIIADYLSGQCYLTVIDVLDEPELAEADKIVATPTLIKESPPPVCRIVGDLSEREKVVKALGLSPSRPGQPRSNKEERDAW